jgi:hypothetical protein
MHWKGCETKRGDGLTCRHFLGGTEENHETLRHDSWSPGRDLNTDSTVKFGRTQENTIELLSDMCRITLKRIFEIKAVRIGVPCSMPGFGTPTC